MNSNSTIQINFRENPKSAEFKNRSHDVTSLGKTTVKRDKLMYRFVIDFGPDTTQRTVECDSTWDLAQRSELSSVARHLTWYDGTGCRVWLYVGSITVVLLEWNMAEILHALCSSKFLVYEIKKRGMGGSCGTHVLKGSAYSVWFQRDCLEGLGLIAGWY